MSSGSEPAGPDANQSSTNECYLSIVVPFYNAAEYADRSLTELLGFLRSKAFSYEVLTVDDGSTDSTVSVLEKYRDQVQILRNKRNSGKGFSVRRGMLAAKGKYIFFTDADMPYDLKAIDAFLTYLDVKEFDLAIGARDVPNAKFEVQVPLIRKLLSRIFIACVSRVVLTGVTDTQCGLKGFRQKAARNIFSRCCINRFAFDVEVIYLAVRMNLDIKRLPVMLVRHDCSTIRFGRDSFIMACDVLRVWLNYHRGKYGL